MAIQRTTAFTFYMTNVIHTAIKRLATRTNRYYAVRSIPLAELRDMLIPPNDRADAVAIASKYDTFIADHAFMVYMRLPRVDPKADYLGPIGGEAMSMTYSIPRNVPGSFVVRAHDSCIRMNEGAAFVDKAEEWITNACRWGFVQFMFDWVNDFAETNSIRQVRHLLPGVVPLLKLGGEPELALKLSPPVKSYIWRSPDFNMRDGLIMANQIIAEGLLYAEQDAEALPGHEAALTHIALTAPIQFHLPMGSEVGRTPRTVDVYPIMDV